MTNQELVQWAIDEKMIAFLPPVLKPIRYARTPKPAKRKKGQCLDCESMAAPHNRYCQVCKTARYKQRIAGRNRTAYPPGGAKEWVGV